METQASTHRRGARIRLRPLAETDVGNRYYGWVNDPEVNAFLEIGASELSLNDLVEYVRESPRQGRLNFAIVTDEENLHIGNGSIYDVNRPAGSFKIGYLIGDKAHWGGISALQAIYRLLEIGFEGLNLSYSLGGVDANHVRARLNNKQVGYREGARTSGWSSKTRLKREIIELRLDRNDWEAARKRLRNDFPDFFSFR